MAVPAALCYDLRGDGAPRRLSLSESAAAPFRAEQVCYRPRNSAPSFIAVAPTHSRIDDCTRPRRLDSMKNKQPILRPWTIQDSEELYMVRNWGKGYFRIGPEGRVYAMPRGFDKPAFELPTK